MNLKNDIYSYKAVLFDLDGTLIDSAKDLSYAIDSMAEQMQIEKPGLQNVKNWIGHGTLKLVESAIGYSNNLKPSKKDLNHGIELFSSAYKDCVGEHSTLYEGTQKLLVNLLAKQIKIACITNKPYEYVDFLLQQNMIRQFFSMICAGDKVKHKKPHPWSIIHVSETFNVELSECLMIGDSNNDIEAARRAGCDVIAVSYGYNNGEYIKKYQPNRIINSFNELI